MDSVLKWLKVVPSRIQIFKRYLDKLQDMDIDEMELQFRLSRFEKLFDEFDEYQTQVEINSETVNSSQVSNRFLLEEEFVKLIVLAKRKLEKNEKQILLQSIENEVKINEMPSINEQINTPKFKTDFRANQPERREQRTDLQFEEPGPMSMQLGEEVFWKVLRTDKKDEITHNPSALGFVTAALQSPVQTILTTAARSASDASEPSKYFKDLVDTTEDSTTEIKHISLEERAFEELFRSTTANSEDGGFQVGIGRKDQSHSAFGDSKDGAMKCGPSLDTKLQGCSGEIEPCQEFVNEDLTVSHVFLLKSDSGAQTPYGLLHSGAEQKRANTDRLKVVCGASAGTSTRMSLNDITVVEQSIQPDILNVLLGFRSHRRMMTADQRIMYRQIVIREKDKSLPKVFWGDKTKELWQIELNTVTNKIITRTKLLIWKHVRLKGQ